MSAFAASTTVRDSAAVRAVAASIDPIFTNADVAQLLMLSELRATQGHLTHTWHSSAHVIRLMHRACKRCSWEDLLHGYTFDGFLKK